MLIETIIARVVRYSTLSSFTFDQAEKITAPKAPGKPIHLYVHIPFCLQLCPYCSFHRVSYEEELARAYFRALRYELELYHHLGFLFESVYIGGGTPTILLDELVKTLELINTLFGPENISVETNPDRLEKSVLQTLSSCGVQRVSVGIQTFNDSLLRRIGRYEKYGSGKELETRIRQTLGVVDTLNVDMIYNFPSQNETMLAEDLEVLARILPDQITCYPLMVSDLTRREMRSTLGKTGLHSEKRFYHTITSHLAGLYEPSSAWCFSRSGESMIDEYIVSTDEYVGAGSGAFGLVDGAIYANTFSIEGYIASLECGEFPLKGRKSFSARELARYTFLMGLFGLRLDLDAFQERYGKNLWCLLGAEYLFFLLTGGIRRKSGMIELTEKGQYYWVVMMREFFTGVDNFRELSRTTAGVPCSGGDDPLC